jgi:hypothetical protein
MVGCPLVQRLPPGEDLAAGAQESAASEPGATQHLAAEVILSGPERLPVPVTQLQPAIDERADVHARGR